MNNKCVVIDYGIGGFDLFLKLKTSFPELGITYLSDTGVVPYGKMSKSELKLRIEKIAAHFKSKGYKHIIFACHSASSEAINLKYQEVENILSPTQENLNIPKGATLGIIGGGRTVRSKLYANHFKAQGVIVRQRIAQELSVLIETADWDHLKVEKALMRILKPIKNCDYLLLACTHYPIFLDYFKRILPNTVIIDPLQFLYHRVEPKLSSLLQGGKDYILTSGSLLLMGKAIEKSYGVRIKVNQFEIN